MKSNVLCRDGDSPKRLPVEGTAELDALRPSILNLVFGGRMGTNRPG